MPLQPQYANGRVRLLAMAVSATAREDFVRVEEIERVSAVAKRRLYYAGEQYERDNRETAAALGIDWLTGRLPEHRRLHAYSTQIQECVDFLADQMASAFEVEADDAAAQAVIDGSLRLSPDLSGTNDDTDVAITNVLRDALIAGDAIAEVRWDATEGMPYYTFWESEQVRLDYDPEDRNRLERVLIDQIVWVQGIEGERQATKTTMYRMGVGGCVREVWYDDDLDTMQSTLLGYSMLPWVPLRASKKTLSASRGESVITQQAMETADRYNAVEQVAWLIARYNSHGNLAVIGDAATLKGQQEERIEKDVADVLTFPGGTALTSITLPTDPKMIEHQRDVLLDSIYGAFGLTRIDQTTVAGLGGVSGYALEILNRKTDGTFSRIRAQVVSDMKSLFNAALDMAAFHAAGGEEAVQAWEAALANSEFEDVTLDTTPLETLMLLDTETFPNRAMSIRLGGAYIVDDVLVRDDYIANLTSRPYALRQRGLSDDEITQIEREIEEDKPAAPETGSFGSILGNGQLATVGTSLNGAVSVAGTAAGDTLSSTSRG